MLAFRLTAELYIPMQRLLLEVALAGDLQHPAFDFLAFGTRFAKTGGNDDPGLHALLHALLDDG